MSFPQDEVLVCLMRGPKDGMTSLQIADETGRAESTVRVHLKMMERISNYPTTQPWVEKLPGHRQVAARWRLTEKGREIARYRSRRM